MFLSNSTDLDYSRRVKEQISSTRCFSVLNLHIDDLFYIWPMKVKPLLSPWGEEEKGDVHDLVILSSANTLHL